MTTNHHEAETNLFAVATKLNSNNNGQGFDSDDRWSVETQIKIAQVQATLAVADAIASNKGEPDDPAQ